MSFTITQGDSSPSLVTQLSDNGVPIDLSDAREVTFIMEDEYKRVVIEQGLQESVNILDEKFGEVEFIFDSSETKQVGEYNAEFEVEYLNGDIETFPTGSRSLTINIVEQIA